MDAVPASYEELFMFDEQSNNSKKNRTESPTLSIFVYYFSKKLHHLLEELLTVFIVEFLDLIYQHNVLPPDSTVAAIQFIIPTINLLIIVIPSFTHYKIFYGNFCPTLDQRLTSKLRTLINNPILTQELPPSQNHQVARTVTLPNNPSLKSHHLNYLIKRRTSILSQNYCHNYR